MTASEPIPFEMTDEEIRVCGKALAQSEFSGSGLSFEDYWNFALTDAGRATYTRKAAIVLAASYLYRTERKS